MVSKIMAKVEPKAKILLSADIRTESTQISDRVYWIYVLIVLR